MLERIVRYQKSTAVTGDKTRSSVNTPFVLKLSSRELATTFLCDNMLNDNISTNSDNLLVS